MVAHPPTSLLERPVDWPAIREAFVKRQERPDFSQLSSEFTVSEKRLRRAASDEGWAVARASYVEQRLAQADAGHVILAAVRADAAILRGCTELGLATLERLKAIVTDEKLATRAASTQSQVITTCMFAFANLTKGLKDAGVSGLSQQIRDGAQKDNGRWNGELLQQINVTVQNLQAAKSAAGDRPVTVSAAHVSGDYPHGNSEEQAVPTTKQPSAYPTTLFAPLPPVSTPTPPAGPAARVITPAGDLPAK